MEDAFEEGRTIVLIKPIYQDPHSVIPQLNAAIVKGCGEERLCWVKSEPYGRFERAKNEDGSSRAHTLDTIALGFEFGEHHRHDGEKSEKSSVHVDERGGFEKDCK